MQKSRGRRLNPNVHLKFKIPVERGAWVAPSLKSPTLDHGWGHDLGVLGCSPVSPPCSVGSLRSPLLPPPPLPSLFKLSFSKK